MNTVSQYWIDNAAKYQIDLTVPIENEIERVLGTEITLDNYKQFKFLAAYCYKLESLGKTGLLSYIRRLLEVLSNNGFI